MKKGFIIGSALLTIPVALMLAFTPGVAEFEGGGNRDQSSAIACAVSFYGPVDMVRLKSPVADEVLPLFLGGAADNAPSAYRLTGSVPTDCGNSPRAMRSSCDSSSNKNNAPVAWFTRKGGAAGSVTPRRRRRWWKWSSTRSARSPAADGISSNTR